MKRLAVLLLLCTVAASSIMAQTVNLPGTRLRPDETVLLYGDRLVDNIDPITASKVTSAGFRMTYDNGFTGKEFILQGGEIGNINSNARFDLYFPKKPNGQMVIVCPGGSYYIVSSYNEGIYVADWMLEQGITVAIVKYRLPNGHWEVPLTDIQNTFRYCREHAAEWNVNQIGVMGFSAGGHLASTVLTMYTDPVTRPDFGVLVYPVITFKEGITHNGTHDNLIGNKSIWSSREGKSWEEWDKATKRFNALEKKYSTELQVSSDTPKTFIVLSSDDTVVPAENSLLFYKALVSHKVPAEMHCVPDGGHGWGFSKEKYTGRDAIGSYRDEVEASLSRWLKETRTRR